MKKRPGLGALALTAAVLAFAAPAPSHAASEDLSAPTVQVAEAAQPAVSGGVRPMTEAEAASAGCLVLGTASVGAAYAVGASQSIMLIGGGIMVPGLAATPLLIALTATLGAASCSMGAVLAPVVRWAFGGDGGAVQVADGAAHGQ
ncbi:membrane hypothetical protein [uncultured Gammaproteobacteria bacterium]